MTDKKKEKAERAEIKPVRKHISWSHSSATITIPAEMRDAMGIRPKERTEVEISLLEDRSGVLVLVISSSKEHIE